MDGALLLARLLLAIIFLIAGLSKITSGREVRSSLLDFGVPRGLVNSFAVFLPFAELVTAICLIPRVSAWYGAVFAFILLMLFVTGIGYNLVHGRRPDCHCFGQLYSGKVGWLTLIRNALLAVMALFIIFQGPAKIGSSTISWLRVLSEGERIFIVISSILFFMVVAEGWLIWNLILQNGRLVLRMDALEEQMAIPTSGLSFGIQAPSFRLLDLKGELISLSNLIFSGTPVLLIFWNPNCRPCLELVPEIVKWQKELSSLLTIVLISRGSVEENLSKTEMLEMVTVLVQDNQEVSQAYKVSGTPGAVIVRPDGRIGSQLAIGTGAIRQLVESQTKSSIVKSVHETGPSLVVENED